MKLSVPTRNDAIVERLEPFVVALPSHAARLELHPFGLDIPADHVIDPTRMASAAFLHRLQTLDQLTFGPEGMPMPRWVFYDCAELPGAIFGFSMPARRLPAEVRRQLGTEDPDALVPLSMYIAIPMKPPAVWFGHNLASLNPVFPDLGLAGLASITKAVGLAVFRCGTQFGATQWDSEALDIHTRFGPLELITAWTPAHSEAATLTYRFDITEQRLRHALGDPSAKLAYPEPELEVDQADEELMQRLQAEIEQGARYVVAGRPRRVSGHQRVPLARTPR